MANRADRHVRLALVTIPLWWLVFAMVWFAPPTGINRRRIAGETLWQSWPEGLFAFGLVATTFHLLVAVGVYQWSRGRRPPPFGGNGVLYWLPAVVFGPIVGWCFTGIVDLTRDNWQSLYLFRVLFSSALPIATALPLIPAARDRHFGPITALFLAVNTLVPAWAGLGSLRDLIDGAQGDVLVHTERTLAD